MATTVASAASMTGAERATAHHGLPDPGEVLPVVAWPTVALFAGSFLLGVLSVVGYLTGALPGAVTVLLNAVVGFLMFSVMHDASHHAIGRSDAINDWFGRLSILFIVSYGSFAFFRFIHIEHHRNTNEEDGSDPDRWCSHGPRWMHPLRWMTIDLQYTAFWLKRIRTRPRAEVAETALTFTVTVSALVWAFSAGYALEAVVLYLLPQRIALTVLAWWFDYLPHNDLTATARSDRYQATRNRVGSEWLFTPVMLSQNYHLVHHLHPSIPFYAYMRAWRRNEDVYMTRDVAISTWGGRALSREQYYAQMNKPLPPHSDERARFRFHALRVSRVDRLTPDSVAITFDVPAELRELYRYTQGQHITLRCPQCGDGDLRRSYSICAPVSAQTLRIGVRHVPGGAFSTYALERLQAGETLDVMPPSGRFSTPLQADQARQYAAIAVGSGITPMLSIIQTTLEVEARSRFTLVFGNRRAESVMFLDELRALQQRYLGRLRVLHVLSAARDDDADLNAGAGFDIALTARGRIDRMRLQRLLGTLLLPTQVDEWFICGPQALVETAEDCLRKHGVADTRIHHELFIAAPVRKPGTTVAVGDGAMSAITIKAGGVSTQFALSQNGETVLDAAMRERSDLPYSCLGGACGTCRARLCSGSVAMEQNFALGPDEVAAGYVLTCQSRPTSDKVVLDYDS